MILLPNDFKLLLNKFEKVVIEIINEKNDQIKKIAKGIEKRYAEIEPILNSDEYQNDLKTYLSIQSKYENQGIDIPKLLGYEPAGSRIGVINVEGEDIEIDEDIFFCEEGITIILKIFDLLDIDCHCKTCIVRAMCQKLSPDTGCKKVKDILEGDCLQPLVIDILSEICWFSQRRAMET